MSRHRFRYDLSRNLQYLTAELFGQANESFKAVVLHDGGPKAQALRYMDGLGMTTETAQTANEALQPLPHRFHASSS